MARGILVSAVALILVIGCALGIIATMHYRDSDDKEDNNDKKTTSTTTNVKAVTVICQPTEYKEACERTLAPLANDTKATAKDYVLAAIRSAKDEVKKAFDAASNQTVDKNLNGGQDHARVEECKKLLDFAIQDLESAVLALDKAQSRTLGEHMKDIRNWLTAVYSFQSQCKGAIKKSDKYKSVILDAMLNATQLSDNALAIASGISDMIESIGLDQFTVDLSDLNLHHSRRLLDEETIRSQLDSSGYPKWFPKADRKLLSSSRTTEMSPLQPDAVVAQDGSGQFKTIGEAVAAYPSTPLPPGKRYVIHVKAGVYDEQVLIQRHQENVFIYGDGPDTIVTGNKSVAIHKLTTPYTATFSVEGKGFIAKSMTFRNTAGPNGEQAVALRIQSEGGVVYDCRIEGYQDTLLYHNYRQFYRDCIITGTIDFIFGEGTAVIQNSLIVVRKPKPGQVLVIVADGNEKPQQTGGLVLQNCTLAMDYELVPEKDNYDIYLARPWMPAATTAIIESDLGDFINPEGYVPWPTGPHDKTCRFYEYNNKGPRASPDTRVKWNTLSILRHAAQAEAYTAARFIDGREWLIQSGVPYNLGLIATSRKRKNTTVITV